MTRRRTAAGLAALTALTGTLVFAGALSAQADPGLDITSTTIEWTGGLMTVTGNAALDNPTVVDMRFGPVGTAYADMDPVCSDVPDIDGDFLCINGPIVAPGLWDFGVVQAGPVPRQTIQTVTVTPPTPDYNGLDPHQTTEGQSVTVNGFTTVQDTTVTVDVPGVGSCTTAFYEDSGSAWSCIVSGSANAPADNYTMFLTQTSGGVTGAARTVALEIFPAPLLITSPANGSEVEWIGDSIDISGTSTNLLDAVEVYEGGEPICTPVVPEPDGSWSCTTFALFPAGDHTVMAMQDSAPDVYVTFTVLVPNPQLDTETDPELGEVVYEPWDTSNDSVAFSGFTDYVWTTVDPEGAYVEVNIAGQGCQVAAVDGFWSCPVVGLYDAAVINPGDEIPFTYSIRDGSLEAVDPAEGLLVVGDAPPASPEITSPTVDEEVVWATSQLLTVTGRAAYGEDVTVEVDGDPFCTATPDYNADWSCEQPISPGVHEAIASQGMNFSELTGFEIVIPAPGVDGLPLGGPDDDSSATIYGSGYDNYTVRATLTDGEFLTQECLSWIYFGWSCSFDLTAFPIGEYTVIVEQFFDDDSDGEADDPDLTSLVEEYPFEVYSGISGSAPVLNCTFSPNGGFRASSPQDLDYLEIWELDYASPYAKSDSNDLGDQGYCNGDAGTTVPLGPEFDLMFVADCGSLCNRASLTPGSYEVAHQVSDSETGGVSYEYHSYVFTIPNAPNISTVLSSGDSVLMQGTGDVTDTVRVQNPDGGVLCSATVTGAGTWACAFPKSTATEARAITLDQQSGGMSAYSAYRVIPALLPTLAPLPQPVEPDEQTVAIIKWLLAWDGDLMNLRPGDSFSVTIDGFPEGWTIEMWMHSTPRLLASDTATGEPMTMLLTVPDDAEAGAHEFEMVATTPLGTSYYEKTAGAVFVDGVAEPETPIDGDGNGEPNGGFVDRNQPAAPTALSSSIPTLSMIADNPGAIVIAAGLAIALLFLVAVPTELLNSSISSNTSRLGRIVNRLEDASNRLRDWFIGVTKAPALAAAIIVVIVAIVFGFVDPNFGFDLASLRLVLSLGIAFFVLSYGVSWVSGLIVKRAWGAESVITMQPSIILFAVVGVVVARLLDFSPGFLIGIAIGVELVRASKDVLVKAILVQFGLIVGLSLLAWVVYSLMTTGGRPSDFGGALLVDTLAATTAEGLMAVLVGVFPLRFLEGRDLWERSKLLWAGVFIGVATAFSLLVLPVAIEGTEVGDLGVWLIVFAVFAVAVLTFWYFLARADRKAEEAEQREKVDA